MEDLQLEVKLSRLMQEMLVRMADEINDEDFHQLPAGGGNSPNWIVGHLTIANEFGLATLGETRAQLAELLPTYGPGTRPTEELAELQSKQTLLDAFRDSSQAFLAAASSASPEHLRTNREQGILYQQLPLVGDLLGHLLTTHLSLHIGQLSAWRRARGMDSLLQVAPPKP